MLISAAAVLALAGGGYALHGELVGATNWESISTDGAQRIDTGSALTAVQPAVTRAPRPATHASASPSTSPSPKPAGPKPSSKPSSKPTSKPTKTTPPSSSSVVDQLLAQINALRAQHGLPAYTLLKGLIASAHAHNLRMMGSCGMSHQCPGEASLGARITAQGVHWTTCGENIGWSGPHPNTTSAMISAAEGLTTAMYNETPPDDGHRLNLLSSQFHHIGIDVVRDSSGKVWLTQDFSN